MNNGIKYVLIGGGLLYLFRSQLASLFSSGTNTAPSSSSTSSSAATSSVPTVASSGTRAAALQAAGGSGNNGLDVWAWYWQNTANLGSITPVQMDSIIAAAGGDRSKAVTASQFAAYAAAAGV